MAKEWLTYFKNSSEIKPPRQPKLTLQGPMTLSARIGKEGEAERGDFGRA
jgi:hypothetical protein